MLFLPEREEAQTGKIGQGAVQEKTARQLPLRLLRSVPWQQGI